MYPTVSKSPSPWVIPSLLRRVIVTFKKQDSRLTNSINLVIYICSSRMSAEQEIMVTISMPAMRFSVITLECV